MSLCSLAVSRGANGCETVKKDRKQTNTCAVRPVDDHGRHGIYWEIFRMEEYPQRARYALYGGCHFSEVLPDDLDTRTREKMEYWCCVDGMPFFLTRILSELSIIHSSLTLMPREMSVRLNSSYSRPLQVELPVRHFKNSRLCQKSCVKDSFEALHLFLPNSIARDALGP